jgi:putative addiction module component (TIGR02574 family)
LITQRISENIMDLATVLLAARSLSYADQLTLVQTISQEIVADAFEAPLTEAQKQELDRRLADDDASPDDVIPWEAIKAEAKARSRR